MTKYITLMLNLVIEFLTPLIVKYKWLALVFFLLLIIIPIVWKCTKDNNEVKQTPQIVIINAQKYDSTTQKKIRKIDSTVNANVGNIRNSDGERLQYIIDSLFVNR